MFRNILNSLTLLSKRLTVRYSIPIPIPKPDTILPETKTKLNEPTILDIVFVKPQRPVNRVFLHCSASDNPKHDNVETIDQWHKQRGWTGIGYHFYIDKAGKIHKGRDINIIPAAQAGHNNKTIAICLGGLKKENFTHKQKESLKALCKTIDKEYDGGVTFHGHREVSAKACPVYDYVEWLRLNERGVLGV